MGLLDVVWGHGESDTTRAITGVMLLTAVGYLLRLFQGYQRKPLTDEEYEATMSGQIGPDDPCPKHLRRRADEGNRTPACWLGTNGSTFELHPHWGGLRPRNASHAGSPTNP